MTVSETLQRSAVSAGAGSGGLPIGQLLAFTVAGFLAIMTETLPAGLLPQIGAGLGISEAVAGQMVTLYALGSVAAAIPVIAATRSWNRRPLFLLAITGLLVFNTITAISAHVGVTLVARFIAGMAAGVVWGLVAGYARRLAPPHRQGRALAIVGVGQPIALSLGVPLGAWLGSLSDWRLVFWILSAEALLLLGWVRLGVPDFPGQGRDRRVPVRDVFTIPGIRPVLLVLFAWILAHNSLYTYVAPFLAAGGMSERTDLVLLIFGAASLVGLWVVGALIDRHARALTLLSAGLFGLATLIFGLRNDDPAAICAAAAIWGLAYGGVPTLFQAALAKASGDAADIAQAMLVTVWNVAIAGGGLVGGLLLDRIGTGAFAPALLALLVPTLIVIGTARQHGFPSARP